MHQTISCIIGIFEWKQVEASTASMEVVEAFVGDTSMEASTISVEACGTFHGFVGNLYKLPWKYATLYTQHGAGDWSTTNRGYCSFIFPNREL